MNNEKLNRHAKIWKYPLLEVPILVHEMPVGAKPLHIGPDAKGRLCIWCIIDPEQPLEKRSIYTVFTNEEVPIGAASDYVGTISYEGGVNHIFMPVMAYAH